MQRPGEEPAQEDGRGRGPDPREARRPGDGAAGQPPRGVPRRLRLAAPRGDGVLRGLGLLEGGRVVLGRGGDQEEDGLRERVRDQGHVCGQRGVPDVHGGRPGRPAPVRVPDRRHRRGLPGLRPGRAALLGHPLRRPLQGPPQPGPQAPLLVRAGAQRGADLQGLHPEGRRGPRGVRPLTARGAADPQGVQPESRRGPCGVWHLMAGTASPLPAEHGAF
mmetsp:Transcript_17011/g.48447  ORF Transcript_17011/g.48447 Transcript_17011/m.48447 type:complete len:219 (-) Transcript_17011:33-689(-)